MKNNLELEFFSWMCFIVILGCAGGMVFALSSGALLIGKVLFGLMWAAGIGFIVAAVNLLKRLE